MARHLLKSGLAVEQVVSRNSTTGKAFASEMQSQWVSLSDFKEAEALLICIPEGIIADVVRTNSFQCTWAAHSSGSLALDALNGIEKHGVFYPIQTMSKGRLLQAEKITICIEANTDELENELVDLLTKFGGQDVVLLHDEITKLQTNIGEVDAKITRSQTAIRRAKQLAEKTRKTVETNLVPLEKLQVQLQVQEEKLRARIKDEGQQEGAMAYFRAQTNLIKKQEELEQDLHQKEQLLLALRQDICSVDLQSSSLNDRERKAAKLYIEWKELLWAKVEQEISFRQQQYDLLMHINARRETLHIITDVVEASTIDKLKAEEQELNNVIETMTERIKVLENGLNRTQAAINEFRVDFEQMRVALMVKKAAQNTAVDRLTQERNRLRKADEYFESLFAAEKTKILAEMDAKWGRRLVALQNEAKQELHQEQRTLTEKLDMVKAALHRRFQAGLGPIINKVRKSYEQELKEHRHLEQEVATQEQAIEKIVDETHELQQNMNDMEQTVDGARSIQERDALLSQLGQLWKEMKTDVEDIATFYSDLDLIAPYSDAVLNYYENSNLLH